MVSACLPLRVRRLHILGACPPSYAEATRHNSTVAAASARATTDRDYQRMALLVVLMLEMRMVIKMVDDADDDDVDDANDVVVDSDGYVLMIVPLVVRDIVVEMAES